MRVAKWASVLSATALLACVTAASSAAQEAVSRRAPIVRIYSTDGVDAISTSTYVTPVVQVAENAYVFVVAMDLDGQIQVLSPDFPGISVKLAANRQVSLPNFFAGFNQPSAGYASGGYYSSASFLGYDYNGYPTDSRGVVIALASRAPFNLEKIEVGGDWNMSAIRRLIENRAPLGAAQSLAAYLGAQGEPIGRDFMRFAGGGNGYDSYGYNAYDPCAASYGYAFAPLRRAQLFAQINYLNSRRIGYRIAGFDLCGSPILVPVGGNASSHFPFSRPPRNPGDTTVFPKNRFPSEGTPRRPHGATTAEGIYPLPPRSGLQHVGDVTITAPRNRRAEPGDLLQGYRPVPGAMSVPLGRSPVEHAASPAATGAEPVRVSRPEPRVESPPPQASSPPPASHSAPPASPPPSRTPPPASRK
ncbi:MAG TPA: hypothetical protein VGG76_04620 [Gemmatimonadaceae bacterium]|jgi:hypothetical protein